MIQIGSVLDQRPIGLVRDTELLASRQANVRSVLGAAFPWVASTAYRQISGGLRCFGHYLVTTVLMVGSVRKPIPRYTYPIQCSRTPSIIVARYLVGPVALGVSSGKPRSRLAGLMVGRYLSGLHRFRPFDVRWNQKRVYRLSQGIQGLSYLGHPQQINDFVSQARKFASILHFSSSVRPCAQRSFQRFWQII